MVTNFVLHTRCCDGSGYDFTEKLDAMTSRGREIKAETFFRHIKEAVAVAAVGGGYDVGARGENNLRLSNDYAVRFFSSVYQGKRCYYMVWSAIEHVFMSEGDSWSLRR